MWLSQFISSSGYCSRRQADRLIKDKKVKLNKKLAVLGDKYDAGDLVEVDGEQLVERGKCVYLMLHKPQGITCTAARHIEGNIIDYVNYPERIFPIGRLDKQSEGLILLTNDGSIVNHLLQEENHTEKGYIVTVDKVITRSFLDAMSQGVDIYNPRKKEYTKTNKCRIVQLEEKQFKIILTQGLNRQIRRMCRRYQYTVTRLQRVRMKDLSLGTLELGAWRHLTVKEVNGLKRKD